MQKDSPLPPPTDYFPIAVVRSIPTIGRTSTKLIFDYLYKKGISKQKLLASLSQFIRKGIIDEKQAESIKVNYDEQEIFLGKSFQRISDMRLIGFYDNEYPPLLRHCDTPPAFLYARGHVMDWQDAMVVAVVGARNMTPYGKMATETITHGLAEFGAVIVSGLMYGVDTTAHFAALQARGYTVAVLGYGFDHIYPSNHRPVLNEFLKLGGTLYTEYAPWQPPIASNFPNRNTIVAGMAEAVLVPEAAEGSGTMITTDYANDNGRTVFAVPGPIDNPYTAGTRHLVNEGATLVASAQEIISNL